METTGALRLGQIVCSKSGRDKDRLFIVVDIVDHEYVLIADGDLRKVEKPKKKKVKHLQKYNIVDKELEEKLENDIKVDNIYVRRQIEKIGMV